MVMLVITCLNTVGLMIEYGKSAQMQNSELRLSAFSSDILFSKSSVNASRFKFVRVERPNMQFFICNSSLIFYDGWKPY